MLSTRSVTKVGLITAAILIASATIIPVISSAQGRGSGKPEGTAERVAERKAEAETKVEEKRLTAETKTQEKRQQACERRVAKLESSMERIANQATRLLGVIDSFHEKVERFYDSGQLTVSNYDELIGNVDIAQEAATVEIATLSELVVDIDCEDPEVAVSVNAFKNSAGASKEALKNYRKALVALISSMRAEAAEKEASEDSSDDSTESEDGTETEDETETENETETETETVEGN